MKIKIIAPETGIQVTKHVIVHAGDVVDIPFHQAEHLIRLKQAVIAPLAPLPLPDLPELSLPIADCQLPIEDGRPAELGLLPPTTAEI